MGTSEMSSPRAATSSRLADADFLARPTLEVARSLVGCTLLRGRCLGRIVETEAYTDDAASHYVMRPRTARALIGSTHGLVYVFASYGVHLCLNFTTDALAPGAVLLRALEPLEGLELMRRRRHVEQAADLCRGPGCLAQALGITRALSGASVLSAFSLMLPEAPVDVIASPRVGITRARDLPWRFSLAGSRHVSRPRPSGS
jgi:DNA-3-methyladenine glycosylase